MSSKSKPIDINTLVDILDDVLTANDGRCMDDGDDVQAVLDAFRAALETQIQGK